MAIVNRTPHPIRILDMQSHALLLELPAAKGRDLARVEVEPTRRMAIREEGKPVVPVCSQRWGDIIGLPPQKRGEFHVVSCVVAAAACCNGRGAADLLVPGELVRDKNGNIVGAAGLVWAAASLPFLSDSTQPR